MKPMIDRDALIEMISKSSARQGEAVRATVRDMTLRALQGRELTLQNVRKVLKQVTDAASQGAAANPAGPEAAAKLLEKSVAGIDDALLKAVEASRVALQRFVEQGVDLQQAQMKKALSELEKMEDALIGAVRKHAGAPADPAAALWTPVLEHLKLSGTGTGAKASETLEQLGRQMQAALRDSRAMSLNAAGAMAASYAAIVGGVLLGMSEGLRGPASGGKDRR